jgi:RNA recognition motif-containing protein
MNKKLYVGGLSYSTTQDALKQGFEQAGTVESAIVITDKMTGRSKGFGFVEMATEEEATKAMDMLNGKDFDGRRITVSEARPMEPRPRRDFGGNNSYGRE